MGCSNPRPAAGCIIRRSKDSGAGARAEWAAGKEAQAPAAGLRGRIAGAPAPQDDQPEEDVTGLVCIGTEKTHVLERVVIVIGILRPKYVGQRNEDRGVIIGRLPGGQGHGRSRHAGRRADAQIRRPPAAAAAPPAGRHRACEVHVRRMDCAVGVAPCTATLKREALSSVQADETRI